jgi:acetyltransferase-like isoleucine patch superfamily enzyme
VFKSDHIRMGEGCTLGPSAFVHYGVTLGDHVVLDADSFLMKGEVLDPHTTWRGNPAKLFRRNSADATVGPAEARDAPASPDAGDPPFYKIAAE